VRLMLDGTAARGRSDSRSGAASHERGQRESRPRHNPPRRRPTCAFQSDRLRCNGDLDHGYRCQAIAKAETVRGNAARPGRSVPAVPRQDAGTGRAGGAAAPRPERSRSTRLRDARIRSRKRKWPGRGSSSRHVERGAWFEFVRLPPGCCGTSGAARPRRRVEFVMWEPEGGERGPGGRLHPASGSSGDFTCA
jgi:hypothetical protein